MKKLQLLITLIAVLLLTVTAALEAQPGRLASIENELLSGKADMTLEDLFGLMDIDRKLFFEKKKIENGFVNYIRKDDHFQKLSFSTMWFDFKVLVDTESDKVLYSTVNISGIKSPTNNKTFEQFHTPFYKDAVAKHEAFYEVSIDITDENMSPIGDYAFGTGCGWGGSVPPKGVEMFELVKKRDVVTLNKWMRSMNPAIQAYGVMGLYFMEKDGAKPKLSRKDKKVMEYIKTKNTIIDYCSNIELNATTPMANVLSTFYLDNIWKLYKESKYLK